MSISTWKNWQKRIEKNATMYRRETQLHRVLPVTPDRLVVPDDPDTGRQIAVENIRELSELAENMRSLGDQGHWAYDQMRHVAILSCLEGERMILNSYSGGVDDKSG